MSGQTTYVSNEVWQQLPQRRLPRGRTITALIALLALAAAIGVGQLVGLFQPRLGVQSSGWSADQASHKITELVSLRNNGMFTTTVSTVTVGAPWLHLTGVTIESLNTHGERGAGTVITLKPGDTVSYTLAITIPDCTAIDKAGSTASVTAHGPLWTRTVDIRPPGTTNTDGPGLQTWTGPTNPNEMPWPLEAATLACKPVTTK
jgi:hypothetical protein